MSENNIDLSVIVPAYNVEKYIGACIDSLLKQGNIKIEIIVIDDGSPDKSGEIADLYSNKHQNISVIHKKNGGLGNARNVGVDYAKGKYIAFVDSDDIVPDMTYENMIKIAERNQSQLTICNVAKFNSQKKYKSYIHNRALINCNTVSHILKDYHLINDGTAWNKVIDRKFYIENKFVFPEGMYYEDMPVTIPMHIKCNHVSIWNEVGYLWRVREGGEKSICQNESTEKNIQDLFYSLNLVDEFIKKQNIHDKEFLKFKDLNTIEKDIIRIADICVDMQEEEALLRFKIINNYIDASINKRNISELGVLNLQKIHYIQNYDLTRYKKLKE